MKTGHLTLRTLVDSTRTRSPNYKLQAAKSYAYIFYSDSTGPLLLGSNFGVRYVLEHATLYGYLSVSVCYIMYILQVIPSYLNQ